MKNDEMYFKVNRRILISIRDGLGLTQAQMAARLGMKVRAYSDLETGNAKCRAIHVMAAERVTLKDAKMRGDRNLLAPQVLYDIEHMMGD